jgi:hypothetical protein
VPAFAEAHIGMVIRLGRAFPGAGSGRMFFLQRHGGREKFAGRTVGETWDMTGGGKGEMMA